MRANQITDIEQHINKFMQGDVFTGEHFLAAAQRGASIHSLALIFRNPVTDKPAHDDTIAKWKRRAAEEGKIVL